ncbi:MAG TPA: hypothetical protein P5136_01075 [Methanofastidiosum sp.]|nr:hypothetical protein [Methanofastidiosum sp.]
MNLIKSRTDRFIDIEFKDKDNFNMFIDKILKIGSLIQNEDYMIKWIEKDCYKLFLKTSKARDNEELQLLLFEITLRNF